MMRSARLNAYLALETAMFELDGKDDPLAETLRVALDPIWHGLSHEERALLNARGRIAEVSDLYRGLGLPCRACEERGAP